MTKAKKIQPRATRSRGAFQIIFPIVCLLVGVRVEAMAERCMICGEQVVGDTIYLMTDKVTVEKKHACSICVGWPDTCFVCGLPARKDYVKLSDGRFLCARDAKKAVLNADDAKRISLEVREDLNKLLSRFVTFPTNVEISIVDRIDLLSRFKIPGNDYECPNILGYFRVTTNHNRVKHEISLMSALTVAELKETCAHEYSHAWVSENVPEGRRQTLARDAEEGFCELVGYLLMDSQGEEEQKKAVLRNAYTHGQIDLFIEAKKRYGFNEIVDWMKYGVDAELEPDALHKVRNAEIPRLAPATAEAGFYVEQPTSGPEKLVLKGISWTKTQPLALINNRSFAPGESGKVRVGTTNLNIRCLAVGADSARIQVIGSGEELNLSLIRK